MKLHKMGLLSVALALAAALPSSAQPRGRYIVPGGRRRLHIDTDRCYLAGAGEGGRTACAVAFAYPEAFGGVLAIGSGSPLRPEPDRRERVKERLSVALLTGERAPGRPELERYTAAL